MGVNVEGIDKILDEVTAKRKHLNLLQEPKVCSGRPTIRPREGAVHRLGEIDVEMVYKNYGLHALYNYGVHVIR